MLKKQRQSFRTNVLLLLGTAIAIFVAVIFTVQQAAMSRLLLEAETDALTASLTDIRHSLALGNERIQTRAEDIAFWPETVALLRTGDDDYAARNADLISPAADTELDLLLIRGMDASPAFFEFKGDDGQIRSDLSLAMGAFLDTQVSDALARAQARLDAGEGIGSGALSGIARFGTTPYALSIAPVVEHEAGGQIIGAVLVGNRLSGAALTTLAHGRDLLVSIDRAEMDAIPGTVLIHRLSPDSVQASLVLEDMQGHPLLLTILSGRETYQDGQQTLLTTGLLLIGIALLFILITYLITARRIVRPIEELSRDIQALDGGEALDARKYSDSTEFDALCASINNTVGRLNESTLSLDSFDHVLNGMDAFVYVSDPVTGSVIFINDRMVEEFGIEGDPIGRPCWTLLDADSTGRCAYCPLPALARDPDHTVIWEETNRRTGRNYRCTDSMIDWADGRRVHLHHRVDITDIREAQDAVSQRLRQQEIMSDISRGFIETHDVDAFIGDTLRTSGEFVGGGRSLIIRLGEGDAPSSLAYEWADTAQGFTPLGNRFVPYAPGMPIYDALVTQGRPHFAMNAIDEMPGVAHMRREGASTSLSLPILRGGQLWGIMTIGIFSGQRDWSDSDIHLFSMIASVIAAVLERSASDDALLRMSSIAQGSPDYICYITPDGEFEYINEGARGVTGYTIDELMAGSMRILYDEETLARIFGEILPMILRERKGTFELPFYHKNGRRRLMSISAFAIGEGEAVGIGSIASDITEQRRLEQDLVAAKEQAERSNHAKSDFLSRMSHEMRTPMNAIIGMTNMAKGTDDIERKEYCLDKIGEASTHLLGVINDILDMSKIEANKFELSASEFGFERMLQKITNIMAFRIDEKDQSLIVNLDPSIPPYIVADEQRLSQVITNLLSNATKFTPEAGTIRLGARKVSDADGNLVLEFHVTDTGIGISPEQQGRLFTAFEQADGGVSRKFGGTGLGLAISKRIVELMGGTIRIESELGQGASFIFTIRATRGKRKASTRTAGFDPTALRVLVVDDAPEVLEYFRSLAERTGFYCDVAADGYEACDRIAEAKVPYNIAFVDWRMPGMDGIELTRHIKANPDAPTAVIMISAAEWSELEPLARDAGVDRFISKPLFSSTIIDCLNECFGTGSGEEDEKKADPAERLRLEGRRLLLAEDIEINREIVCSLLEQTGVDVTPAENGVEAVALFRADPAAYDLIFMDIHMPEMDGYEATRRIRALDAPQAATVPIIAMTANVFREDIERCLAAGMNDHIGKPIDVEEFYAKLRKHMPEKKA